MQQVGTPAFAAQYSEHHYFGANLGKVRFGRNDVLEEPKIKAYFGKGAKLKGMLERAQKKGQVEEDSSASGGDSDTDADGLGRTKKRRKKASGAAPGEGGNSGRGGAGRGGAGRDGAGRGGAGHGGRGHSAAGGGSGGAEMVATAQVTEDTLLSELSSALVTGSRIGATIAAHLPTATGVSTCGELADMEPAAAAKVKIVRFPHVLALRAALRRRLRDGEPTDGGSGSGAGAGMADVAGGGATAPASDSPEVSGVAEAAGAASGAELGAAVCDECCIKCHRTLRMPTPHQCALPALCALPVP